MIYAFQKRKLEQQQKADLLEVVFGFSHHAVFIPNLKKLVGGNINDPSTHKGSTLFTVVFCIAKCSGRIRGAIANGRRSQDIGS